MRFRVVLMGMELVSFEFAWPARGVFPVPESILSEEEIEFGWPEEG